MVFSYLLKMGSIDLLLYKIKTKKVSFKGTFGTDGVIYYINRGSGKTLLTD